MMAMGTVPEWIAAVGAVIAAIGTVGALRYSLRLVRDEECNRRADEFRRAKGIARRLSARLEPGPVGGPCSLTVQNTDHELHFYEVEVFTIGRQGTYAHEAWPVIAPGEEKVVSLSLPQGTSPDGWTIALTYRDDEGNWWHQVRDGSLTAIDGPPPKRTLAGTPPVE
jgi:hypothetical protein